MFKSIVSGVNNLRIYILRRFFPAVVIEKCGKLIEENKDDLAYRILTQSYDYHRNNYEINELLRTIAISKKDWHNAAIYLNNLLYVNPSLDKYLELAVCYSKINLKERHNNCIQKIIEQYPKEIKELKAYIKELIREKSWNLVQSTYNLMIKNAVNLTSEDWINLSMISQINGDYNLADNALSNVIENFQDNPPFNEDGYKKIILYDNGESRIEFYKKNQHVDQVVVLFDSINMHWNNAPFSYKYLKRKNIDMIAVRKRQKGTYQQDLLQEDFIKVTEVIANKYNDKVAYGYSLGAYNVLYYASLLNCRIYSLAPRLSIHPVYGRTQIKFKQKFKDKKSLPYNDEISPIIVYDPKNKIDKKYVQNEIQKQFPKAKIIKIKYGGHAMAHHLLRTGQLKQFVDSLLQGSIPTYDEGLRIHSSIYFRRLADECFAHNKYKWALNLVNRSLDLVHNDINTSKIKVKILIKTQQYNAAIDFIKGLINDYPKLLRYRILLINTYIKFDDFTQARKEWIKAVEFFGSRQSLRSVKKLLDNKQVIV